MDRFSQYERRAALAKMEQAGVDILVIGGGITGSAVAMDAAVRGYSVGLVEKRDFSSGTSSRSTKLVHGGLRYLPQLDFGLVHEALVERGLLFENAPWIVRPLGFVLPLYSSNRRPLGLPIAPPHGIGLDLIVQSGLMLYDGISGGRRLESHRRLSVSEALARAPALQSDGLSHAFLYYDGQTDDCRLTLAVLKTAFQYGAPCANYAAATGFQKTNGRISATLVRDLLDGKEYAIPSRYVVNAGGVFAQRIEELTGEPSQIAIEPAKGVHLVFSKDSLPIGDDAVVLPETDDGRLLFILPWEGRVLVGTTDTAGGDIDQPIAVEEDIAYLLAHCNRYLRVRLKEEDILSTFAGYRPLVSSSSDKASARLSRSHAVLEGPAGMISLIGGKLTTWRRMGEDAVNLIARRDGLTPSEATKLTPLDGMLGWPLEPSTLNDMTTRYGEDVTAHLQSAYGGHLNDVLALAKEAKPYGRRLIAELPYLAAEVIYACRYEMALRLEDVLCRRTHIVLQDREQGVTVARDVAALMAVELGWDDAEIERQVRAHLETARQEYMPQPT